MKVEAMVSAAALVTAMLATPAAAQGIGTAPQAEEASQPGAQDIIVTAQRRNQKLLEVPIAITAVGAENLSEAHLTNIAELNYVAPSLNVVSAQGLIKPYLRGVGTQGAIAGIEMPVAIYQDGIYIAPAVVPVFDFTDIQQVEVIKGPQGTLFGRNATAGLLNITSRDPRQDLEISVAATLGSYGTHDVNAFVGGELASGFRASVYARYADQTKGFGTNRTTGIGTYRMPHDVNARAKLLLEPAPDTTIRIVGDYTNKNSSQNTLRFLGDRSVLDPVPLDSIWDSSDDFMPYNKFDGGGVSAKVTQDFGNVSLVSLTGYRKSKFGYGIDLDRSPISAIWATPVQRDQQFSQELQLQSAGRRKLDWIVGLFYFDAKADLDHLTNFAGPNSPLPTSAARRLISSRGTTTSFAGFAQTDLHLGDATTLTTGLRYSIENRGFVADQTITLNNGNRVVTAFRPLDLDYNKLTWRLSLDHEFQPDLHGYVSYNRGFKSGGYNPTVPGDPSYLPEQIDAYEVGFKSAFNGGAIQLSGAAFYYDYTNIQVSTFQNGVTTIYNGAQARLWGAEASLGLRLSKNFDISSDLSYVNAKFQDFKNGVRGILQPNGGYLQVGGQDLSGNRTPNAPRFTMSLKGDAHFETPIGRLKFVANWYYNSGYFTEADNVLSQPDYHMINLSAKFEPEGTPVYVQLWAKNILDAEVSTQRIVGSSGASVGYQPPSTVGVTFGLNV